MLFGQLSIIENQFSMTVNKADAIVIVMDTAPDEYQAILNTEQQAKGDEITLQDLAETMDQQWRSLYAKCKTKLITGNDGNDTEVALAAFAGKCHNCHQVGHRAADCPHKKNTSKSNKNKCICCSRCGKMGHVEANCWNRPENSSKCPKWYNPPRVDGNEQSNTAVDDGDIDPIGELLCMAVEKKLTFPSIAELLRDPCVLIGDTGATNHITPHMQGMENMKQDKSGTGITMGNDTVAKGTHTGDLPGVRCDHQGNQLDNVVLTNVSVVPSSTFNLFSITKMQLQGWVLGGNKDSLWITKGRRTIQFDIKIKSLEGCVFAMYITRGRDSEMGNMATENNNNNTAITY